MTIFTILLNEAQQIKLHIKPNFPIYYNIRTLMMASLKNSIAYI